jgi:hypothetical protein
MQLTFTFQKKYMKKKYFKCNNSLSQIDGQ